MDYLDEQLEAMRALVESVGGRMGVDPDAPDDIKREFLKILRECPDCQAEFLRKKH